MPRPATVKEHHRVHQLEAADWQVHTCDRCERPTVRQRNRAGVRLCFGCHPIDPGSRLNPKLDTTKYLSGQQPKRPDAEKRILLLTYWYTCPGFSVDNAPWAERGRENRDDGNERGNGGQAAAGAAGDISEGSGEDDED